MAPSTPVTVPPNQFKVLLLTIMHTSDKFPEFSRINKLPKIFRFFGVVSTLPQSAQDHVNRDEHCIMALYSLCV